MDKFLNLLEVSDWENAPNYPDGTQRKILYDEKDSQTVLLKLPEGFYMLPHAHIHSEQHLVIKGAYESEGRKYNEGTYRSFQAHENHGPFESKSGAIVLVFWHPI